MMLCTCIALQNFTVEIRPMVSDNYVVRRGQVADCGLRGSRYQSTMPQVHLLSSWDPILLPNLRRIADTSENSHHSQAVQVITYIHVNLGQAVNMSCVIEKQAMATNGKTKTPITMVISVPCTSGQQ